LSRGIRPARRMARTRNLENDSARPTARCPSPNHPHRVCLTSRPGAHRAPGGDGVVGRSLRAVVVDVYNAKSGAKSRHELPGFFSQGTEALRGRRLRARERRALGGCTASPEHVWGDGSKWVAFFFWCAFQNAPAGRSLSRSSPEGARPLRAVVPPARAT